MKLDYGSLSAVEAAALQARLAREVVRFDRLACVSCRASFPYVPGLFAFREMPVAPAAVEALSVAPDLLLCDGQGIAHPRRFGLASHLGILAGIPSTGVDKTRLVGEHGPLAPDRETAVRYVLACASRYRIPQPIRAAHRLARGESWQPP